MINIENLNELDKYKKIGINNFLFAVDLFSIGYNSFSIETLLNLNIDNIYILINRILDCNLTDKLKEVKYLFTKFKGILFEDIAVYNIFKDTNLELIMNSSHFLTNINTINYWCNLVKSTTISNELTKEEVMYILNKTNKKLVLNVIGKNNIMYSRRTLLTNFNEFYKLNNNECAIIRENVSKNEFLIKENEYGTYIFNNKYYNLLPYLKYFNNDKILYYLICPNGLNFDSINDILNGESFSSDSGFMERKTIYKIGDKND